MGDNSYLFFLSEIEHEWGDNSFLLTFAVHFVQEKDLKTITFIINVRQYFS